ncbi:MAG: hypothetical protein ACWA40_08970 [Planktomarina sp.]
MNAIAFDTHIFVKRLTAAGMPEAQAEVLAEEQARLINERLVAKPDLERLGNDLHQDIGKLREHDLGNLNRDLRHELEILRAELTHSLTLRLGGMMVTGIAVVAALVKLL